jgi:Spy/CpxP family protein refolding chaperone
MCNFNMLCGLFRSWHGCCITRVQREAIATHVFHNHIFRRYTMKKTLLAVAAIATIGLAGYQVAEAQPWGGGPGMGHGCAMMGMGQGQGQVSEETMKAREKFFNENTDLRKKMVSKKTELRAVMSGEKPDEKKAAKLSEELFDLRTLMHKKAQEAGIAQAGFGPGFCDGPGMGMGSGPRHRASRL